jgi:hypothetical protein
MLWRITPYRKPGRHRVAAAAGKRGIVVLLLTDTTLAPRLKKLTAWRSERPTASGWAAVGDRHGR